MKVYPNNVKLNEDNNRDNKNYLNNMAKDITKEIDENGKCINNGNINMNHLDFFTYGSCISNPGPGDH